MIEIKQNLSQKIRNAQPMCIFCAGQEASTQMDHCPPKALFTKKQRAKGLEFGICSACHQPTRDIDAIVATMSRLMPEPKSEAEKNDIEKYAKGLINNHPSIANLFADSATLPNGNFQIQAKSENASRMYYAMHAFCARLGLALYREKTGKIASAIIRPMKSITTKYRTRYSKFFATRRHWQLEGTHRAISFCTTHFTMAIQPTIL